MPAAADAGADPAATSFPPTGPAERVAASMRPPDGRTFAPEARAVQPRDAAAHRPPPPLPPGSSRSGSQAPAADRETGATPAILREAAGGDQARGATTALRPATATATSDGALAIQIALAGLASAPKTPATANRTERGGPAPLATFALAHDDAAATAPTSGAPRAAVSVPPAAAIAPAAVAFAASLAAVTRREGADSEAAARATAAPSATASAGPAAGAPPPGAMAQPAQAPAPAAPPPVALPHLGAEIARRVSAGETRFTVRLDPAGLGRVEVRVAFTGAGEARAHLTVERPETLELIARDRGALERTLRDAGFEAREGSVQVSLRQPGDDRPGQGQQQATQQHSQQQGQPQGGPYQNGHQAHEDGRRPAPLPAEASAATADRGEPELTAAITRATPGPSGGGRIDIRV